MNEFTATLADLFADLGAVTVRKMFGGYGLFCDGLMFAIVVDDILYLKTDAASATAFAAAGLEPFAYERSGKLVIMSFHRAPDEILDDPERAAPWGEQSLAAARRAKAAKTPQRRPD